MSPATHNFSVLLIEDSIGDAGLVIQMLKRSPVIQTEVDHVERVSAARAKLHTHSYDCVLLDLGLPDTQGLEALRLIRSATQDAAIVVLTGYEDEETEIEALQEGAQDYLAKNRINGYVLGRAIRYAVERQRVESAQRHFLDNAAHELRTPLSILQGAADILELHKDDLDKQKFDELVAVISKQGKKVGHLLNQLLELSELSTLDRSDLVPVSLSKAVESALYASPTPDGKSVEREIADEFKVLAHPERLQMIVGHLLTNAYRYGGEIITIEATSDDTRTVLTVADDGAGVPEELVDQLFTPFGRGSLWHPQGSGLGLALTRRLAKSFDAEVAYSPGVPNGARFEVLLRPV
jgi:signal transduction histidine kinase